MVSGTGGRQTRLLCGRSRLQWRHQPVTQQRTGSRRSWPTRADADAIREELAKAEVEAVIPAKTNRRDPMPHDRTKYRLRNLVERLFNKLKNWRRVGLNT